MSRQSEIFLYFLKLGCTGFGGPLALIAMMQKELIEEKGWMSPAEFAQALALLKAMPGALAFQTAVYLGRHRGGRWGGLWAGLGLIGPAFLLMILLASFYELAQQVQSLRIFFNGMQAAAVVLMIQGLRSLSWPYRQSWTFWLFFVAGGLAFYMEILPEPVLILGAGLVGVLGTLRSRFVALGFWPLEALPTLVPLAHKLSELMWVCFKSGAVVFGSGLAIVPLLEREFVERLHWLTSQQFFDALTLGQVTPGPVLMTVTFIGYQQAGWTGAVLATACVFLPGFFHMQTWFPSMIQVLRRQSWIEAFLVRSLGVICGILLVTIFRITQSWGVDSLLLSWISLICALVFLLMAWPSWALIFCGGFLALVA